MTKSTVFRAAALTNSARGSKKFYIVGVLLSLYEIDCLWHDLYSP